METKRIASCFYITGLFTLISLASQSCSDPNPGNQAPEAYVSSSINNSCESYSRESLALFNNNMPSMIKLAEQIDSGYDPNTLEVFSALSFAFQIAEYEEKMKAQCPESFAVYEQDRNNLLAIHGLKALAGHFMSSN